MRQIFRKSKQQRQGVEQPARRRAHLQGADEFQVNGTDLSSRHTFRRNRTLTGSSSANIISTNELNAEFQSPRAHVHHLASFRRKIFGIFLLVTLCALGLYLLLSQLVASQVIAIRSVAVIDKADSNRYKALVESYYGSRPVERLLFLLNEKDLLGHIQDKQPEVKGLSITNGGRLGEAALTIEARKPIARWSIDGVNQYVDEHGIVFSRNYYTDPGLQIIDESGLQTSNSRLVASNRFLGFVGRVVAAAQSRNLDVSAVTIPIGTTRQVALTLAGKKTVYKLSVDRSAGQQVEDIERIDHYLTVRRITPRYVDVRITGKAYYK